MPSPTVLCTRRLALRGLETTDAGWIQQLFSDPDVIRYVGDRGLRSLEDAERYLLSGPIASYERRGFGLWRVELATTGEPCGIAGLVQRDYLPGPDLGFAFLPAYRSRGYATEAATAVLSYAQEVLGISRVLAITTPDNEVSQRILRRLGFEMQKTIRVSGDEAELSLFATGTQTGRV
jgi:RimJ/RimL family protein N-acetyltransferase